MPTSICVFCGSSTGNDSLIIEQAQELGVVLANNKIALVYGAAKIGIMGIVAQAVLEHQGKVIGIIPEFLKTKEVVHSGLTQLITTQTMHDRKMMMQEKSDAFIALPGGIGTLEELFEIFTWLQLGLHQKPIGLLNSNGYYDALLSMLQTMVKKGFVSHEALKLLLVSTSVEGLLQKISRFTPPTIPEWLNKDRV